MADLTDKGQIIKYGGGVLAVRPVDDAGTYSSGDVTTFGKLLDVELKYDKPMEDIQDETGNMVASLPGVVATGLTGTFMQSGVALLDFLRDDTEGKFYQLYYKMSPTNGMDGKTQELFAGICVIKPSFSLKSGEKRIPFEIKFLKNDDAITITTPNSVFGSVHTSTVTIPIGKYYDIVET